MPRTKPNRLSHARRAELVESCRYLAKQMANRYVGLGLTFEELESAALYGLVYAATRFDPKRGTKFITYAHRWIRQAILRDLEMHWMKGFKWNPTAAHAANKLDPVPIGRGRGGLFRSDFYVNPVELEPDDGTIPAEAWDTWNQLVRFLTPTEKVVAIGRFRDDRRLQDIGDELGICRERVRQIELRLIDKLRRVVMRGLVPEVLV